MAPIRNRKRRFWLRLRFLTSFPWKDGSDGSGFWFRFSAWVLFRAKKTISKKTHKQNFHGIVPDYPGIVRHFPEISWEICLCVSFFSPTKRQHMNKFDRHPFPGQSREVVYVYRFCSPLILVAQCSATPASVAATPPCSARPFQRQLDVRYHWQLKGDRCDRVFYGGCSATLLPHLQNPRILRKSAATRVVRHV